MIQYQYALNRIREIARTRSGQFAAEEVSLNEAIGRIVAHPVVSSEEVPSFTNSSMDGFALCSKKTLGASPQNPLSFEVMGLISAGDFDAYTHGLSVPAEQSVEIMTGAPLPEHQFDSVVKIEDVQKEYSTTGTIQRIAIRKPLTAGENIRRRGTDFSVGQGLISAGKRFTAEHLLACSSLGISKVSVKRKPKVVVISTGSELVSPAEPVLKFGMIRNSTGPFLETALQALGVDVEYIGVIQDDPVVYRETLERIMKSGVDIVISTGAVSMGKFDFVAEVLTELNAKAHFHKVAIRPGKPLLFAELGSTVFFGVPGNPVSTAVGLRFFIEPYLRVLMGLPNEEPLSGVLSQDVSKPEGLRCFFKAKANLTDSRLEVVALKGQASYIVSALVEANSWVVLSEESSEISNGTRVDVFPLQNSLNGVIFNE